MIRPLARDTNTVVDQYLGHCLNLGLILDKYQPWRYYHENWDLFPQKGRWLNDVHHRFDDKLRAAWLKRSVQLVESFGGTDFLLYAQSHVVIGLGTKNTLEMGLTLHSRYGLPYIPGSALKGVARKQVLYGLAKEWGIPGLTNEDYLFENDKQEKDTPETPLSKLEVLLFAPQGSKNDPDRNNEIEKAFKLLQNDAYVKNFGGEIIDFSIDDVLGHSLFNKIRSIFGCMSNVGEVIFFDAIPAEKPQLVVEIMTPHYQNYYKPGNPPRDDDNPIPIPFLAVETGSCFSFGLGLRPNSEQELIAIARQWLVDGLKEIGVGGKTSSGMGIFDQKKPVSDDNETQGKPMEQDHHDGKSDLSRDLLRIWEEREKKGDQ